MEKTDQPTVNPPIKTINIVENTPRSELSEQQIEKVDQEFAKQMDAEYADEMVPLADEPKMAENHKFPSLTTSIEERTNETSSKQDDSRSTKLRRSHMSVTDIDLPVSVKSMSNMHNISSIGKIDQSFKAEEDPQAIFENMLILERNISELNQQYPDLIRYLEKHEPIDDVERCKNNKFYDYIRNFKYFKLYDDKPKDLFGNNLKQELNKKLQISDILSKKGTDEQKNHLFGAALVNDTMYDIDEVKSDQSKKMKRSFKSNHQRSQNKVSMVYFGNDYKPKHSPSISGIQSKDSSPAKPRMTYKSQSPIRNHDFKQVHKLKSSPQLNQVMSGGMSKKQRKIQFRQSVDVDLHTLPDVQSTGNHTKSISSIDDHDHRLPFISKHMNTYSPEAKHLLDQTEEQFTINDITKKGANISQIFNKVSPSRFKLSEPSHNISQITTSSMSKHNKTGMSTQFKKNVKRKSMLMEQFNQLKQADETKQAIKKQETMLKKSQSQRHLKEQRFNFQTDTPSQKQINSLSYLKQHDDYLSMMNKCGQLFKYNMDIVSQIKDFTPVDPWRQLEGKKYPNTKQKMGELESKYYNMQQVNQSYLQDLQQQRDDKFMSNNKFVDQILEDEQRMKMRGPQVDTSVKLPVEDSKDKAKVVQSMDLNNYHTKRESRLYDYPDLKSSHAKSELKLPQPKEYQTIIPSASTGSLSQVEKPQFLSRAERCEQKLNDNQSLTSKLQSYVAKQSKDVRKQKLKKKVIDLEYQAKIKTQQERIKQIKVKGVKQKNLFGDKKSKWRQQQEEQDADFDDRCKKGKVVLRHDVEVDHQKELEKDFQVLMRSDYDSARELKMYHKKIVSYRNTVKGLDQLQIIKAERDYRFRNEINKEEEDLMTKLIKGEKVDYSFLEKKVSEQDKLYIKQKRILEKDPFHNIEYKKNVTVLDGKLQKVRVKELKRDDDYQQAKLRQKQDIYLSREYNKKKRKNVLQHQQ